MLGPRPLMRLFVTRHMVFGGQVQGVMPSDANAGRNQTRHRGGATNEDDGSVSLTLEGPYRVTEEIVTMLAGTQKAWERKDSVKEVKCDDQPRATADMNGA